jgi:predicted transcriptional regulator
MRVLMGSSAIPYLTDTEKEVIHLLVEVGLKSNEARILVVFFRGIEPTSRDLERITDLRQPEVSIAVTGLTKRKWISVSHLITANKGRPVKIFALIKTIDDILDDIKEGIATGHDQQMILLGRIREIIRGK